MQNFIGFFMHYSTCENKNAFNFIIERHITCL